MANPLIGGDQGLGAYGIVANTTADVGSYDPSNEAGRGPNPGGSPGAMSASNPSVGTGSLTAEHNLPLHVAGLIILGLAVVFGLRAAGFKFAVTAGVGR